MTGKADFSADEWELVREGPAAAGMYALMASRGGSFRETWALAKTYAEARQERGESELLDELVADKPSATRYGSHEELEQQGLRRLSEAVALLEQKATIGEVEGYRHFVLDVAGKVAEAHREEIENVSHEEREAIEKIAASLRPASNG
ncbi:MAG TPA: hypothetical protein VFL41_05765 [Gaiellaceae bacterium]|nr:hypothetical protein [Gaiellaceae bacterium]